MRASYRRARSRRTLLRASYVGRSIEPSGRRAIRTSPAGPLLRRQPMQVRSGRRGRAAPSDIALLAGFPGNRGGRSLGRGLRRNFGHCFGRSLSRTVGHRFRRSSSSIPAADA